MRLRFVATLGPQVDGFGPGNAGDVVSFLPLDRIWPGRRFDPSFTVEFTGNVHSYNPVKEGDLLVPKVSPTFAHGRTAIARGLVNGRALATSEVFVLRAHDERDANFLQYRLRDPEFLARGRASWQGVAGLKRVSAEYVKSVQVDEAVWQSRHAIAGFLDRETTRLGEAMTMCHRAAVAMTDARHELVGELLHPSVPIALKRVGVRVTQGWSPQAEERPPEGEEAGVLKLSAVSTGVFLPDRAKALAGTRSGDRERYAVHSGNLLMVRASGSLSLLGRVCIVDKEPDRALLYPDIVYRLECENSALPADVLIELLGTPQGRDALEMVKRGAANNKIRLEDVRNLVLPIPGASQLARIAETGARLRPAIRRGQALGVQVRERLAEYRDSLIHEAVTGKLDVTRVSERQMDERLHAAAEGRLDEVVV